jgi:hypothetical protein
MKLSNYQVSHQEEEYTSRIKSMGNWVPNAETTKYNQVLMETLIWREGGMLRPRNLLNTFLLLY